MSVSSPLHAIRLLPGDDLHASLNQFTVDREISAGAVLTCVGSLAKINIRLAGRKNGTTLAQKMEILALSGTLSKDGCHVHISLADSDGRTVGGHLLPDSIVHTTAEIVIIELSATTFRRAVDPTTGYRELVIQQENQP